MNPRPVTPRTDQDVAADLGRRLKAIRTDLGWSQERMAHATHVSFSTISQIERGDRAVRLATLLLIADGLDMKPGDLVDCIKPPDRPY